MRWPFGFRAQRPVPVRLTVRLHVDLGFQAGRLADLIQFLARSAAIIKDLETDRSLYHLGMPERFAVVTILLHNTAHRNRVMTGLAKQGFNVRILTGSSG